MKRYTWLMAVIMFALILTGCQTKEKEPSPKEVTKQFLTAIQKQDEAALEASSQWNITSIKALQMQEDDYIENIDRDLQKAAHDVIYGFTFTIKDEIIKEKKAEVNVLIYTKDIKNAVKTGMREAEKKVEELSKGKHFSDQKAQQEIMQTIYTHIQNAKTEKKQQVTITLTKNEDTWKVTKNNKELEKALLSNGEELIQLIQ